MSQPFLDVRDLRVQFPTEDGIVNAVDGVAFSVEKGRTLAIVGESGSGKSVTSQAIMGLINRKTAKMTGEVYLDGEELVGARPEQVRSLRGKRMAMIFQDPLSSLHPFYTIGKQLAEAVRVHQKVSKSEALGQARVMLDRVGIPNPERRLKDYPHNLSGGMRQRVMIAMALLNDPELLIADEPTTALDVTVQAQILDLLRDLQSEFGTAIVLITHDLGVVADMANDVVVMYGGRVVERGSVEDIYYRPEMPYTWGLLGSVPRMDVDRGERLEPIPGQPPSLIRLPKGCVFRPRCPYHELVPGNRCDTDRPDLLGVSPDHAVRCHLEPAQRKEIAEERLFARGGVVAGGGATAAQTATATASEAGHRQGGGLTTPASTTGGTAAMPSEPSATALPEPGAPGTGSPAPSGSDPRTETTAPEDPQ
jgi:peptide/nickel transport system ATP-binding protein